MLHDISLFQLSHSSISAGGLACRYLFADVVSDEKFSPVSDYGDMPANIGAFKVSDVTVKYAGNLFESLLIPWQAEVRPEDYDDMKKIIERYYTPGQYKLFCEAFAFQQHLAEKRREGVDFVPLLKFSLRAWKPGLFAGLRRVKNFMRGRC